MDMIYMPDNDKDGGNHCFRAMRQFRGRHDSAREETRKEDREPDDKPADTHE